MPSLPFESRMTIGCFMKRLIASTGLTFILVANLAASAFAQEPEQVLMPMSMAECEAAWERNNKKAEIMLEEVQNCRAGCSRQYMSGNRVACGGEISAYEKAALAGYHECAPAWNRLESFYVVKRSAFDKCEKVVKQNEALKAAYDLSNDDSALPAPIEQTKTVTEKLRAKTTTGSPATDKIRDESTRRAVNATAAAQREGLKALSETDSKLNVVPTTCADLAQEKRFECLSKALDEPPS